jgi:hypothetical protein
MEFRGSLGPIEMISFLAQIRCYYILERGYQKAKTGAISLTTTFFLQAVMTNLYTFSHGRRDLYNGT